jgi:hypothetical protein
MSAEEKSIVKRRYTVTRIEADGDGSYEVGYNYIEGEVEGDVQPGWPNFVDVLNRSIGEGVLRVIDGANALVLVNYVDGEGDAIIRAYRVESPARLTVADTFYLL